jgi:hypothetical protein
MTTIYTIQQSAHNGATWEPVPEGDFDTFQAALAAMRELQDSLGWRGLRITRDTFSGDEVVDSGVLEYGLEHDPGQDDED